MTSAELDQLVEQLQGAYSTVFARSLARTAVTAITELREQLDVRHALSQVNIVAMAQTRSDLDQALAQLEACRHEANRHRGLVKLIEHTLSEFRHINKIIEREEK